MSANLKKEVNDEVYFWHADKHRSLLQADTIILGVCNQACPKFAYLCNISSKAWEMKSIFCLDINTKVFYKLIVSPLVCISRHTQNAQNNTFTISLQHVKENMKDEVDFFYLFQSNTIILGVCGQACPDYPKQQVCYFSAISE